MKLEGIHQITMSTSLIKNNHIFKNYCSLEMESRFKDEAIKSDEAVKDLEKKIDTEVARVNS